MAFRIGYAMGGPIGAGRFVTLTRSGLLRYDHGPTPACVQLSDAERTELTAILESERFRRAFDEHTRCCDNQSHVWMIRDGRTIHVLHERLDTAAMGSVIAELDTIFARHFGSRYRRAPIDPRR